MPELRAFLTMWAATAVGGALAGVASVQGGTWTVVGAVVLLLFGLVMAFGGASVRGGR